MIRTEHRIDVSTAVGMPATLAVTVFRSAPDPELFAFATPGGGYTRTYFDLSHPALPGPGQAEYHATRGWAFAVCDPLGTGESGPVPDSLADLDTSAHAAHLACTELRNQLRLGPAIGIGHSLGGMQLIHQQSRFRTFSAIAVLGFSAVHTFIPTPAKGMLAPAGGSSVAEAWSGELTDDLANVRYAYHWDDVAPEVVADDLSAGFPVRTADTMPPWISRTFPPFAADCMAPGVVADQAATIDVPVFLGAGERDVLADIRAEAAAYPGSRDITIAEVPRCAHMHNFSPQREILWQRLHSWADTLEISESPVIVDSHA
ncbi:alpha/beta fold hydrolase [Nocardia miyunensis]|uniref:alpha/beta fold hydrolase n=1 Tax=Nocardia miyunensis TaxID=282684 RepID=UPI000835936C|nr:alpha/beta hydrolase [Nocardia miyunensis]